MKEKTSVYFRRRDVSAMSWIVSGDSSEVKNASPNAPKLERIERGGISGYILPYEIKEVKKSASLTVYTHWDYARLFSSDLPVEFFNHELQAVDASDEASVFSFVKTWGFPFLMDREWHDPSLERAIIPSKHDQLAIEAISEKKNSIDYLFAVLFGPGKRAVAATEETEELISSLCGGVRRPPKQACISAKEAALGIETLQSLTNEIFDSIRADEDIPEEVSRLLNLGSSRTVLAGKGQTLEGKGRGLPDRGYLTSAVCNQILDTMADTNVPWRICAYRKCNRLFKRQSGSSKTPHADSVYCCKKHMENQKKINQREAARNRIQH